MALQPNQRSRSSLMFRLGDLINFLNPDGKFILDKPVPFMGRIENALNVLHSNATIPFIDDTG